MFKTILFELKSLIQNLKRNFLQPTLDFGLVILAAHPTFFSLFSLCAGPSGIWPTRPLWPMVHREPFFLLRSLAPPPPVRPAAAIVRRAPVVHHEKPSRCTVPPPSVMKPNPVESPPPPLKSFENRWGLKPTSPADRLHSPPLPPGPYKRAPHPRPSAPCSFSLSSPHPRALSTSSLSLLRHCLPSTTPSRPSPSTNSCHPG
jgi:hypothetical protein